jgi:CDP-diacylglycerol pyrophosphatase
LAQHAAAAFLGMWVVMMEAMMLPYLVPMLWRYRQVVGRPGEGRLGRPSGLVGLGHLLVWTVFGMATLLALIADRTLAAADPDALWKIVHGRCVPHVEHGAGPAPCRFVDLSGGYAILKDLRGATQFLLIATTRLAGIESPEILADGAPNYWHAAWQARRYVAERAGRDIPREDIGLAINARSRRSQDQFHIHIDCVRADVKRRLADKQESHILARWIAVPLPPGGHPYLVRRVESSDLTGIDPVRLLAEEVPAAGADMGDQTLVVIGGEFRPGQEGFFLLTDRAASPDRGWGEELLDHDCAVLKGH